MKTTLQTAIRLLVFLGALLGIVFPAVLTLLANTFFHAQATGDLVRKNGVVIGSKAVGQLFVEPGYFHGRPSSAGVGYDALASGGSNLAATNRSLADQVAKRAAEARREAPGKDIPVDLVTASGSGLDPDLSPAAAMFQVDRVARERGVSRQAIVALVARKTQGQQWGIFGEPRVNVLELNMALDRDLGRGISESSPMANRRR